MNRFRASFAHSKRPDLFCLQIWAVPNPLQRSKLAVFSFKHKFTRLAAHTSGQQVVTTSVTYPIRLPCRPLSEKRSMMARAANSRRMGGRCNISPTCGRYVLAAGMVMVVLAVSGVAGKSVDDSYRQYTPPSSLSSSSSSSALTVRQDRRRDNVESSGDGGTTVPGVRADSSGAASDPGGGDPMSTRATTTTPAWNTKTVARQVFFNNIYVYNLLVEHSESTQDTACPHLATHRYDFIDPEVIC